MNTELQLETELQRIYRIYAEALGLSRCFVTVKATSGPTKVKFKAEKWEDEGHLVHEVSIILSSEEGNVVPSELFLSCFKAMQQHYQTDMLASAREQGTILSDGFLDSFFDACGIYLDQEGQIHWTEEGLNQFNDIVDTAKFRALPRVKRYKQTLVAVMVTPETKEKIAFRAQQEDLSIKDYMENLVIALDEE